MDFSKIIESLNALAVGIGDFVEKFSDFPVTEIPCGESRANSRPRRPEAQ
jgi:hypothetical protein